jgi:hypothetical protein
VVNGRSGHYGPPGMRDRAARVGGKLIVWSAQGAGTEIELSIPGQKAYGISSADPPNEAISAPEQQASSGSLKPSEDEHGRR